MDTNEDHSDCYIEQFAHRLPHRDAALLCKCNHSACAPHTLTYYGNGDDPELEGDYCMICFGNLFGTWPDKVLQSAVLDT
jgi:hypothetical protein